MSLSWVDYFIVGVIALSVLTGLFRGFVKELMALIIWVVAIWLAYSYSNLLHPWLSPYIHDATAIKVISFIIIMLATLMIGAIINFIMSFIMKRSGLSGTDRVLGMGFGFVRGIFIVAVIMLVMEITAVPVQQYQDTSKLYQKFTPLVKWLSQYVPGFVKQVEHLEHRNEAEETDGKKTSRQSMTYRDEYELSQIATRWPNTIKQSTS